MENGKVLKVRQLRYVVDAALRHIEDELGIDEVELREDLYWEVPAVAAFDLSKEPNELEVGNLFDDLDFLSPIAFAPENANALTLLHVYPLLKYLANRVPG